MTAKLMSICQKYTVKIMQLVNDIIRHTVNNQQQCCDLNLLQNLVVLSVSGLASSLLTCSVISDLCEGWIQTECESVTMAP